MITRLVATLAGAVLLLNPITAQASGLGETCHGYDWIGDFRMHTPEGKGTHYWLSIYQREDHERAAILVWDDNAGSRKRWMFGKVVRVTGKNRTVARTGAYYATECPTFKISKGVYKWYGSASKRKGASKIASDAQRVTVG